ncbi:MAG: hypothetical protein Ta2D_08930 [Rickettsiales bacterium]|nr:MAG: hypothetical protein Ta2D_08930 [Rickettsiales bacterium]
MWKIIFDIDAENIFLNLDIKLQKKLLDYFNKISVLKEPYFQAKFSKITNNIKYYGFLIDDLEILCDFKNNILIIILLDIKKAEGNVLKKEKVIK